MSSMKSPKAIVHWCFFVLYGILGDTAFMVNGPTALAWSYQTLVVVLNLICTESLDLLN
jgi:quinol-cytochrome oxidoreductase complex cytochrome b subunit